MTGSFDPETNEFTDWARRAPEADLTKPRFIMLVSLPAGGKSTYAAHLVQTIPDSLIICPDQIRAEFGDINDQSRNHLIFQTIVPCRISGAKGQGKHIIFDACSVSRKARKGIIAFAHAQGYRIEAHVLDVPLETCKARNAARERVVPVEVLERMARAWAPPTTGEVDVVVQVKPDWQANSLS